MVEGALERREEREELLAWHAAHVMAPHLKQPVQPFQLLGRPTRDMKKKLRESR